MKSCIRKMAGALLVMFAFCATSYSQTWTTVGSAGFSGAEADWTSIAIDGSGTPYVVYEDYGNSDRATVMKFDGTNWVTVGSAGFSAGGAEFTSIAIDGSGTPYVAYMDLANSNKITVKKFNGSSWVTVGSVGFSTGGAWSPSIAIDASGTPYVAFSDAGYTSRYNAATVMKFDGTNWVLVGSEGFSSGGVRSTSIAIDPYGTPYIAFEDYSYSANATVMMFNGTSWSVVGSPAISGTGIGGVYWLSIAIDMYGAPYVTYQVYSDGVDEVMKYNGSSWVNVGGGLYTGYSGAYTSIAVNSYGTPFVVFCDPSASYNASVIDFNGRNWAYTGSAGFSAGSSSYNNIAIDGAGNLYVIYSDAANSNAATVMKCSPPLLPPVITALSPVTDSPGTTINITGDNFDPSFSNDIVYFGATIATVTSASYTSLSVTVPKGSTYFPLSVSDNSTHLTGYSTIPFLANFNSSSLFTNIHFDTGVTFGSDFAGGVEFADLDGDGKADMIFNNSSDGTVSIYLNTSTSGSITSGSFASPVVISTGGTYPSSVSIADFDGDGLLDFAINNQFSNEIVVFLNTSTTGSLSFTNEGYFATGTDPNVVVSIDIDGDGKPDLVVPNMGDGTVSVLQNTSSPGSISFATQVVFTTGSSPICIAVGDIDGDGKPDLVVPNSGSNTVSLFLNTSTPGTISTSSFAAKVDFSTGINPYDAVLGDVDGDGKLDVVVTNYDDATFSVYLNTATVGTITTGSLASPVTISSTASAPDWIAFGDFDGDGKPDLVITDYDSLYVFKNTTTGGSVSFVSTLSEPNYYPGGVAVGDLDGDGKSDIAGAGYYGVTVFRNDPVYINFADISGASSVCIGASTTLSDSTTGGTWTSSNMGVATIDPGSGVVTGVAAGTTTITYMATGVFGTTVITVIPSPSVSPISGSSSVTIDSITILTDGVAGGFWTSSNTSIATVEPSGEVTGVLPGTATITYTDSNMCGSASVSAVVTATRGTSTCRPIINTIGGNGTSGYSGDGGPATAAELDLFDGYVVIDGSGNVFFTEPGNSIVRKINTSGYISTVAGTGTSGFSGDGGAATAAELNWPSGLVVDGSGNLYISDQYNLRVRKVNSSGVITTIAGNGMYGYSGDGGPATAGEIWNAVGLALDAGGNLYIADWGNNVIRKVNTSGTISTVAGNHSSGFSGDGGPAIDAEFSAPWDVAVDASGNIYISDAYNNRIRMVNNSGIVNTIAGNGTAGSSGDGGAAVDAELYQPAGLVIDASGNLIFVDNFNTIRKVNPSGIITSIAGTGANGFNGDGIAPTAAELNFLVSVMLDGGGNMYVADADNNRVRTVTCIPDVDFITGTTTLCAGTSATLSDLTSGGTWHSSNTGVATIGSTSGVVTAVAAGTSIISYTASGETGTVVVVVNPVPAAITGSSSLCEGSAITISDGTSGGTWTSNNPSVAIVGTSTGVVSGLSAGTVIISYVLNTGCKVTVLLTVNAVTFSDGTINTIAGNGTAGYTGDGAAATAAEINNQAGIAFDLSGNLYIADGNNHVIRKVNTSGVISTIAGTGTYGLTGDGGPATDAKLGAPRCITFDASGNMYIVDPLIDEVRKINTSGTISKVAGNPFGVGAGDGGPATAAVLNGPGSVVFDASGNMYIQEVNAIRKVNTSGIISTIAGNDTSGFSGDGGPATAAEFGNITWLAIDGTGNLYIVDAGNNRIRKVNTSGIITTITGNGTAGFSGDGGAATAAELNSPISIALDEAGDIYITEYGNKRVREINTAGIITTIAGNGTTGFAGDGGLALSAEFNDPFDVTTDGSGNIYISDSYNNRIRKITISGAAPITGTLSLCSGTSTTLSDATSGGSWSSTNTSIATIGSTGVVSGVAPGTATISYAVGGSCSSAGVAAVLSVNPLPNAGTITGTSTVSTGGTTMLSDATTGGTWSSSNTSIATVGGTGIVSGVAAGTARISYTVTSSCGTAYTSEIVTVTPSSSVGDTFYVSGNKIYDPCGTQFVPRGVNYSVLDDWDFPGNLYSGGEYSSQIALTGANALKLNWWRNYNGGGTGRPVYFIADLDSVISRFERAGMVTVLALVDEVGGNDSTMFMDSMVSWWTSDSVLALVNKHKKSMMVNIAGEWGLATDAGDSSTYMPVFIRTYETAITTLRGAGITVPLVIDGPDYAGNTAEIAQVGGYFESTDPLHNVILSNHDYLPTYSDCVSYDTAALRASLLQIDTVSFPVFLGETGNRAVQCVYPYADCSYYVNLPQILTDCQQYNMGWLAWEWADDGCGIRQLTTDGAFADLSPIGDTVVNNPTYGLAYSSVRNYFMTHGQSCSVSGSSCTQVISTIAGNGTLTYSGDGGAATAAGLDFWSINSAGIAVDGSGNVYLADIYNNRIRKISASGIITTVAGNGTLGFSGDGGPATSAELYQPYSVVVDGSGNLYLSDTYNQRIRKVSTTGTITTIAGNGTLGFSGDGGAATAAEINSPDGLALDASGNLYMADDGNYRVRKISTSGIITTVAGNGTFGYTGDGGNATAAELGIPQGITLDGSGNVYISDISYSVVRKLSTTGIITTIAGNGSSGFTGDGGPATAGELGFPEGVAVDGSGNLYIGDAYNSRIRKVSPSGILSSIAGNGSYGFGGDGGAATAAEFYQPSGVAVDASGNLYIEDVGNSRIRYITCVTDFVPAITGTTTICVSGTSTLSDGATGGTWQSSNTGIATIGSASGIVTGVAAGTCIMSYTAAGTTVTSVFTVQSTPSAGTITGTLTVAYSGTTTLSDATPGGVWSSSNTSVATIGSSGIVSAVSAGSAVISYTVSNSCGSVRATATLNVYGACAPVISTIAGNGTLGYSGDGGAATAAEINYPGGICQDGSGNLYISDGSNNRIRKISTSGIITTYVGNGTSGNTGDGGAATAAELNSPEGICMDGSNNLYICDGGNNRIRKVTPSGTIMVFAGNGTPGYTGDGSAATAAKLELPKGICTDGAGNFYIADADNMAVRKVNSSGIITTVAGEGPTEYGYSGDGSAATLAKLNGPSGIAIDGSGNLFISDYGNEVIRKVNTSGIISTYAGNGTAGGTGDYSGPATAAELYYPEGLCTDASGNLYIADFYSSVILKVNTAGNISVLTGEYPAYGGDGGVATAALIAYPEDVFIDAAGDLLIADGGNQRIRKINFNPPPSAGTITGITTVSTGSTTTLSDATSGGVWSSSNTSVATVGSTGVVTGVASGSAIISYTVSLTCGIASAIAIITETGVPCTPEISTIAGNGTSGFTGDGGAATGAELNYPGGICQDGSGNLYISDGSNNRIRKISTSGIITTYVGNGTSGNTGDGGAATAAELNSPEGICMDGSNNLYICDGGNNRIRKVTSSGTIVAFAGNGTPGYTGDGSAATAAKLELPKGICSDGAGNFFIADADNMAVRKVNSSGIITTVAGEGPTEYGYSGDGSAATLAKLNGPSGIAIDGSGNLFISDYGNEVIRKVNTSGIISTYAGNGTAGGTGDYSGPATAAELYYPEGLCTDASGNLYIADFYSSVILKVNTAGNISVLTGEYPAYGGDGGVATAALIAYPEDVFIDAAGDLLIADGGNQRIRKITINAPVASAITGSTSVAAGSTTTLSDATLGGAWSSANTSVATINSGGVVTGVSVGSAIISFTVANSCGTSVATTTVTVTPSTCTQVITTIAGGSYYGYSGDGGSATAAELRFPVSVFIDGSGNIFTADINNNVIRKISTSGIITTIAGNGYGAGTGEGGFSGDGGAATAAELSSPYDVTVDGSGNIYIADFGNSRIRKVNTSGIISTVAGNGTLGYSGDGGAATNAELYAPVGVVVDGSNNIYIADHDNSRVRKVNASGIISTIGGNGTYGYTGDGGAATAAEIGEPWGLALDASGNLYFTDDEKQVVRKISSSGIITTVAGNGTSGYSGDNGPATAAELSNPIGLAVDGGGNLFIADNNNGRIRKVSGGIITTLAGGGTVSTGDGGPATSAALGSVYGVAVDGSENVYIGDLNTNSIRFVTCVSNYVAPITGVAALCVSSSTTLSDATTGGTWNSANTGIATIGSVTGVVTGVSAGSVVISYTYSGVTVTSVVTVQVTLSAGTITGVTAITAGGYTTLSDATSGGVWSSSNSSVATVGTSTGVVSGVTAGSAIISYTLTNSCGPVSATYAVGVYGYDCTPVIKTNAGNGTAGYSGDGGPATAASLDEPWSVAVDGSGNYYIADYFNNRIRKVSSSGIITTIAGNGTNGSSGDGGQATAAELNYPTGVTLDAVGNLYIADWGNNKIRKVNGSGVISTVAGNGTSGYSGDGGAATSAKLSGPTFVSFDAGGNYYINDVYNNRIRKVNTSGIITTIAGNGTFGFSGDGGAATAAELSYPIGIAVDGSGNVYISDDNSTGISRRIRKISTSGIISTYAGTSSYGYSGDGGPATAAELYNPTGLSFDGSGNLYIADEYNYVIRKVNNAGVISTVAGTNTDGFSGDGGPATSATFFDPTSLTIDGSGDMYIADNGNSRVRYISCVSDYVAPITGAASVCVASSVTLADATTGGTWSSASPGVASVGSATGTVTGVTPGTAVISYTASGASVFTIITVNPLPVAISGSSSVCPGSSITLTDATSGGTWSSANTSRATIGIVSGVVTGISGGTVSISYILGTGCGVADIITINSTATGSIISTIAGNGSYGYSGDNGPATAAEVYEPWGVAIDGSGNVFIADYQNNRIRKVSSSGVITTIAGNGTAGFSGDGGPATASELNSPTGLALDGSGDLYIADGSNNRVRKISTANMITTVAGNGTSGFSGDGGPATAGEMNSPWAVAVDGSGNLYIADAENNRIRKVNSSGIISTIAGNGTGGYTGDGSAATAAEINIPEGVAVDGSGNVYVADDFNNCIRKITASGTISTVAGNGTAGYSGDGGPATAGELNAPADVYVDGSGNLLIADYTNNRIRKVTASGIISTVAGNGTGAFGGDNGQATAAELHDPSAVVMDGSGNMYICDNGNMRIRKVIPGTVAPISGSASLCVSASTSLTDATTGGTWSSSNTSIATIGTSGVVSGLSAGTVIISYAVAGTCTTTVVTDVITINPLPGPGSISGTTSIADGSAVTLTDGVSGGVWSSSNSSIASIGSTGIVIGVTPGSATISYTVTNGCGSASATDQVTVFIPTCTPVINTIAGNGTAGYTGNGGPATSAEINPAGVLVDGSGNVYIVDINNQAIRKVNTSGIISTIAGNGTLGFSGDGSAATSAELHQPNGIAMDGSGNIYIADAGNSRIRKVNTAGVISTFAGNGTVGYTGDGGAATSAELGYPYGVAVDGAGNIYISDGTENVVRKVNTSGIITTVAGTGSAGFSGDGGQATAAQLHNPAFLAINGSGEIFVLDDANARIRKISASGIISTYAGNGTSGFSGDGGQATAAEFNGMSGITTDAAGSIYITDENNNRVRKVNSSGIISTVAGNGTTGFSGDGAAATSAELYGPYGVAIDASGDLLICDAGNKRVREIACVSNFVSPVSGSTALCAGSTYAFADATSGGTWSSSNTSAATVGSATGIVAGVAPGVAVISYSVAGNSATLSVTVSATPLAITGVAVCAGSSTTLADATPGGSWSSAATGTATIGTNGKVTGVSAGTAMISYTVASGCSATFLMTVNPSPAAISGPVVQCTSISTQLTDATPGGAWSSSNTSSAMVGAGTGIVTGVAGTSVATISYAVSGCSTFMTVTVYATPNSITGASGICSGSTTTYTDATGGGAWSSANPSVAAFGTGVGILSGVAAGTAVISYSASSGCASTKTVAVSASPTAISGPGILCTGISTTLTDATPGGTWSSSNTSAAIVGSVTGVASGVAASICNITYSVSGCSTWLTVTVNTTPNAVSGAASICAGLTSTYADATPGGTWSSLNPAVATIGSTSAILTGVAPGSSTIGYTVAGCSSLKVVTVNVAPSAITGPGVQCTGTSTTFTDIVSGGIWTSSNTSGATVGSITGIVTGVAASIVTISYNVLGCSSIKSVTVAATPNAVSGTATLCVGASTTFSDASSGGTWSSSNVSVGTVSSSGYVTSITAGTTMISYTVGSCASTRTLTVNPVPAPISGPSMLCTGQTSQFTDATPGGTWLSSNTSGATIGTTGIATGMALSVTTFSYFVSGCSVSTPMITIYTSPYAVSGSSSICTGIASTYTDVTTGGTWSSSNTSVATITGPAATGVAAGTVTISYSVASGCASSKAVTVSLTPAAVSGPGAICAGLSYTFTDGTAGGSWTSSNTSGAVVNATSGLVTAVASSVVTISYSISGCVSIRTTTVAAIPYAISGAASVNVGSTTTFTDASTGGLWSSSATAAATVGSLTGIVTGVAVGSSIISYVMPSGCFSTRSVAVVLPGGRSSDGSLSVCVGSSQTIVPAIPGGAWSSSDNSIAIVDDGIVTGISSGQANISYSNNAGGSEPAVTAVQVNALPDAVFISTRPGTTIGDGQWVTFTASVANGGTNPVYKWLVNGALIPGITTASYATDSLKNNDVVACTVGSASGCGDYAISNSAAITVVSNNGWQGVPGIFNVQILPNPNKGAFMVKGSIGATDDQDADIQIRDMLGQLVYTSKVVARNGYLDEGIQLGNNLANGMYILNIRWGQENREFHFVIEQ